MRSGSRLRAFAAAALLLLVAATLWPAVLASGLTELSLPAGADPALLNGEAEAELAWSPTSAGLDGSSASVRFEAADAQDPPRGLTLLSIAHADGSETLGVRTREGIVDVAAAARALGSDYADVPLVLDDLLADGGAPRLAAVAAEALRRGVGIVDEERVRYGRLLTRPGKIICIGHNYRSQIGGQAEAPGYVPPLFNKFNNALAAHGATVKLPAPSVATQFDYETELVVVIGKAARNIVPSEALAHIAGYSIGNDFSARDLQLGLPGGQWMLGKTLDGFAPIGPYFVSADLVPNPDALKLETRVNGNLVQSSSTSDFIFDVQHVVAYVSRFFTLQPGDVIFTGTPPGTIDGLPLAQRHWLKAGDVVTSRIEGLGELRFTLA